MDPGTSIIIREDQEIDQQVNQESFRQYARFRENLLRLNVSSSQARAELAASQQEEPLEQRRKKNNEAAKRSRDSRRAKEDEIAIRAAFLEQENITLKLEAARLRAEIQRLTILSSFSEIK